MASDYPSKDAVMKQQIADTFFREIEIQPSLRAEGSPQAGSRGV